VYALGDPFGFSDPSGFKPVSESFYSSVKSGWMAYTLFTRNVADNLARMELVFPRAVLGTLQTAYSGLTLSESDRQAFITAQADQTIAAVKQWWADGAQPTPEVVGSVIWALVLRDARSLSFAAKGTPQLTGQIHHAISRPVQAALEQHPNLKGLYQGRDPRFVTQAADAASHRGYQQWHRNLDTEVSGWIRGNPNATQQQFEGYLRGRYQQSDLSVRFPNGL
jgi:hypothetical protein